jgi:hypothetical protein
MKNYQKALAAYNPNRTIAQNAAVAGLTVKVYTRAICTCRKKGLLPPRRTTNRGRVASLITLGCIRSGSTVEIIDSLDRDVLEKLVRMARAGESLMQTIARVANETVRNSLDSNAIHNVRSE